MIKAMQDKQLKALVSLLDDEDQDVIRHVEQKIISIGQDVIPFLEEEWEKSFNPVFQRRVEDLIHVLQFELLKEKLRTWNDQEKPDLLEGMWLVSTYQYPDLEFQHLSQQIEQIYYEVWLDFKKDLHPYDQIKLLNNALFAKQKFKANTKNFHSPGNSMINVVLETKKGNPISLCVIYMLIAQKLDMPIFGVNLPNLFICTYKTPDLQFYINAFNKGLIFSKSDIDNYIEQLHLNPEEMYYQPCNNKDIIQRVLRNLIISFEKLGDHHKSDEAKQLLYAISGEIQDGNQK
jgi:regulator of sirC expression with transglutaminase-like and TPR domain